MYCILHSKIRKSEENRKVSEERYSYRLVILVQNLYFQGFKKQLLS